MAWDLYQSGKTLEPWDRIRCALKSSKGVYKKERVRELIASNTNKKKLIILPSLDPAFANAAVIRLLQEVESRKDVILLTQSSAETIKKLQLKVWKSHSELSIQEIKKISSRYSRRLAPLVKAAVVIGFENGHIAQLLWTHSIPVIQFVGEPPSSEESARLFHKYSRYLSAIIFPSQEVERVTFQRSPHASLIRSYIYSAAGPSQLNNLLEDPENDVALRRSQEIQDRRRISKSRTFDIKYSYPWFVRAKRRAVATYTTSWITGINLRKPFPGFHPGTYAEHNQVVGEDPLAHYLRADKPAGPWSVFVIRPQMIEVRRCSGLKTALHIHLYYPEMALDIIRRIRKSRSKPDLLISVPSEEVRKVAINGFAKFNDRRVEIQVVQNGGRDLGSLLSGFASELKEYEVIGHFHTKRSPHHENRMMIDQWCNFLSENVLGGKKPMIDVILHAMEKDPRLGMVFPDDPHVIGWTGNRDHGTVLMKRMGLKTDLPERFINFPVGTMFWARSQALKPLFDLNLDWADYPEEPIPPDGTMLHAIERILPMISEQSGYRNAVTYVRGVFR